MKALENLEPSPPRSAAALRRPRPITIIGGGLAGLTLGIALRRQDIPVTIWEAGRYPRHRVCGEFISGRGQEVLARLDVARRLCEAGAVVARTAVFHLGAGGSPVRDLPRPAWSISRYQLDALLARYFRECGGEMHEAEVWRRDTAHEGLVRAAGRRARTAENGWRWFGLKVHARNVTMTADLEMHGTANGYVGLTRLPGGLVNVCGLFGRRDGRHQPAGGREALLRGLPGTVLHKRLWAAEFEVGSFCAVAGLPLAAQRASAQPDCCVGDALTMVPPITGNGMSMAFEAAELASGPLAAYSRDEISWVEARALVARLCNDAFASRLRWGRLLQWLMLTPLLRGRTGVVAIQSATLWQLMFSRTR